MTDTFKLEAKTYKDLSFRICEMNAIEALAFKNLLVDTSDLDSYEALFNAILEHVEVSINDKWLPVKEKKRSIYYPVGIEDDAIAVQEIVSYFINNFLKPVFTESNA